MADSSKTIFLVDDNLTNLTMGKAALKDMFRTFTMPSAERMFELLKKIKPDLILLDLEMPEMSGWDAIKILKSGDDKSIPVIFLTADASVESKKLSIESGAQGYIAKPFDADDLIRIIEHL
ncbi:MAG: hypothetical protein Ta2G_18300 [Termitinemataceae bacterium]|nr:MAG: hypothetical protein Ta2G_18300 [Termitinemataceae bacterium]